MVINNLRPILPLHLSWCFLFKDPIREYYRPTSLFLLRACLMYSSSCSIPRTPSLFPGPEKLVPAHRGPHVDLPLSTGLGHCNHCPPLGLAHTLAPTAGSTIWAICSPEGSSQTLGKLKQDCRHASFVSIYQGLVPFLPQAWTNIARENIGNPIKLEF